MLQAFLKRTLDIFVSVFSLIFLFITSCEKKEEEIKIVEDSVNWKLYDSIQLGPSQLTIPISRK